MTASFDEKPPDRVDLAGVVLCGGRSSRMGRAKALLPFGDETLLERVIARLARAARPIVVVAAPEQELPLLDPSIEVLRDPIEGEGPLRGIATALAALATRARYAYVTATDAPFLTPELVRRVRALCGDADLAMVRVAGRDHPLAAVYATRLHERAAALLAAGRRRPIFLCEGARAVFVSEHDLLADDALRAADPDLDGLTNLNLPDDYRAALRRAGLPDPAP